MDIMVVAQYFGIAPIHWVVAAPGVYSFGRRTLALVDLATMNHLGSEVGDECNRGTLAYRYVRMMFTQGRLIT